MGLFDNIKMPWVKNQVEQPIQKVRHVIRYEQQLIRSAKDIKAYKDAVETAENIQFPSRESLYAVYESVTLDAHLSAVWEQRKNMTLSKEFCILGADGQKNEEKSKFISKKWFREFLNPAFDSKLYGHSLIQLSMFDTAKKEFMSVELVPRQYVNPPYHVVTPTTSGIEGEDYTKPEYADWVVEVGGRRDLGLLLKLAPLVIWKKNALGAWAEYQESFGLPTRIGKTKVKDETTYNNMYNFLQNFGIGKFLVLDTDDQVELVESGKGDAYSVFDKMIERINSEISKYILGQTGTTDEKSFTGAAEVHEKVANFFAARDEHDILNVLNYSLKPILVKRGLMTEQDSFGVYKDNSLPPSEKIKIDEILMSKYKISPEYIEKTYGTPVEEGEDDNEDVKKIKEELKNLYS